MKADVRPKGREGDTSRCPAHRLRLGHFLLGPGLARHVRTSPPG
ncbi:hypothetical protein HMPREF9946_04489 [Acetobacteraceae bacterium AT-5844]|nr:hypothetical protein HMPREF9946_04489 [Acetobacteraceae bacterium AT-5844]